MIHRIKLFLASFLAIAAIGATTAEASQAYLHVDNVYSQCNVESYNYTGYSANLQARFPNWQVIVYKTGSYRYADNDVYAQVEFYNHVNGDAQLVNCRYTGTDGNSVASQTYPYVTGISFKMIWE